MGGRLCGTPPTPYPSTHRRSSGRQLAARPTCSAEQQGQGGRPGSAVPPPLLPPLPRTQAVDRRGLLALLAAANLALPAPQAVAAPAARPVQPLPVPPLTETFASPEVRNSRGCHAFCGNCLRSLLMCSTATSWANEHYNAIASSRALRSTTRAAAAGWWLLTGQAAPATAPLWVSEQPA